MIQWDIEIKLLYYLSILKKYEEAIECFDKAIELEP